MQRAEAPDAWEVGGVQACGDSSTRRMLPGISAHSLPGAPKYTSAICSTRGGSVNSFVAPSCERMTFEFVIRIAMDGDKSLGLEISSHDDKSMLIGQVKDGAIADWNALRSAMHSVRRGDRIVEVNEAKDDVKLIFGALRQQGVLAMRISRLLEFHFVVTKVEERLGIEFDSSRTDELNVKAVHGGASRDVCGKVGPEFELRRDDRILEINGQSGDSITLLGVIKSASTLDFLVRRP